MDDGKLIVKLWDDYGIKPVIDIRNSWRDGERTRLVPGETNVVYDYKGTVFCHDPASGRQREMAYAGFEKERGTLKYRCPAAHYGLTCQGKCECPVRSRVRIKMAEDRRIFTPLARSSYKWEREYHRRTAVERVNSRIDVVFGFENHYLRSSWMSSTGPKYLPPGSFTTKKGHITNASKKRPIDAGQGICYYNFARWA